MATRRHRWWKYGRALVIPALLWGVVVFYLWDPVRAWLRGSETHDRKDLREWIEESRGNLPKLAVNYRRLSEEYERLKKRAEAPDASSDILQEFTRLENDLVVEREKIEELLDALASPLTKMYGAQAPLFPTIYRMEVRFDDAAISPIVWESNVPSRSDEDQELTHEVGPGVQVKLRYQLHAYDKRQREEIQRVTRIRQLSLLAVIATGFGIAWTIYSQRRERERDRHLAEQEQGRQAAERGKQQAERDLLEQRLAAQEYEQKMLELKSQLYASIGIMAGSYAHNIKNLLVRPNDLLRRCLEGDGLADDQSRMLHEVKDTLGTVTERLQQILRTVRRDPNQSELAPLDLGPLVRGLENTWKDLAREKWKLRLTTEITGEPLVIQADVSHLQQAIENLLFNARDATFEMRNHLREQARRSDHDAGGRKQAVLEANSWKGDVVIRAFRRDEYIVLEVTDNGVGMSDEVRQRCTETHFSTKRDNALFEGHSTGMGLGLSFVQVVLDNHHARMEIESKPLEGTTFRITFLADASKPDGARIDR